MLDSTVIVFPFNSYIDQVEIEPFALKLCI